jgi:hypothetical protein
LVSGILIVGEKASLCIEPWRAKLQIPLLWVRNILMGEQQEAPFWRIGEGISADWNSRRS